MGRKLRYATNIANTVIPGVRAGAQIAKHAGEVAGEYYRKKKKKKKKKLREISETGRGYDQLEEADKPPQSY